MKTWHGLLGVAAALAVTASSAQAQAFGIQGSWGDEADLGIGARVEVGAQNLFTDTGVFSNTFFIGSFDYFFPDCGDEAGVELDCNYWEINGNLAVPLVATRINPYVGAGINVARVSVEVEGTDSEGSDTEIGLNLLGGLRFPLGGVSAFGEARLELGGGEQLVLTLGALLGGSR